MHTDEMMDKKMGKKRGRPAKESGIGTYCSTFLRTFYRVIAKSGNRRRHIIEEATGQTTVEGHSCQREGARSCSTGGPTVFTCNWTKLPSELIRHRIIITISGSIKVFVGIKKEPFTNYADLLKLHSGFLRERRRLARLKRF